MTSANPVKVVNTGDHGPKYFVDIEGTIHPWPRNTISREEIAELGGWDVSAGVIEIDADNKERTLAPGEIVELKPGQGFSKKIKWKRGFMERVADEIALLKSRFPTFDVNGRWVRIPLYPTGPGWNRESTDVAFQIQEGHPAAAPYGIYVPEGMRFNGLMPGNYTEPAANQPPFGGRWGFFSWQPDDNQWKPHAEITKGANLLNWVLGFAMRFRDGQ
jgi:hypothetical protein